MRTIYFDKSKLVGGAIGGLGLPILGFAVMVMGPIHAIVGTILIVGGPLACLASLIRLFGDGIALQFDASRVTIATHWSRQSFAWSDGVDVYPMQLVTRIYGIIPVRREDMIDFKVPRGMFGKKTIRVVVKSLQLSKAERADLFNDLMMAKQGAKVAAAPAKAGVFAKPRDPLEGKRDTDSFDADGVMARYIANREKMLSAPVQVKPVSARPAFGRRALQ